jgi:hypothetical protein
VQTQRNSIERYGEWLATTTMSKVLNEQPDEGDDDGQA